MIKRGILLILILFLAGCAVEEIEKPATIVCNAPYIRHADDCCLDQNNNKICDSDETNPITEAPEEPTIAPTLVPEPGEEIKARAVEKCELNDDLECVSSKINQTAVELELKNNLNNKINFHRIALKGYCTKPFEAFIESGETMSFVIECKIPKGISRIYYDVLYDEYGVQQNRKESGTLIIN